MNIRCIGVLVLTLAAATLFAGNKPVYTESFKKGPERIKEQTLEVTLESERAKQDFKIVDANGKPRYTLRFLPDIPRGDTRTLGWFVRLADAQHKFYDSVLPTSVDLSRDQTMAWWLDGRQFARVPIETERVFKVEQFYCILRPREVKRLGPGSPYLNQMKVVVQFTNNRPE